MEATERHALALASARATFGLPALAAPDACLRLLSRSRRAPGAARFFAGFFGVREVALGVLMAVLRGKPGQLRPIVALGALADMGDSAFLVRHLARRQGVDPTAAMLLTSGIAGSVASLALCWELARDRPQSTLE